MTENEIIEFLDELGGGCLNSEEYIACNTAIKAIKEVQQYRAIGTLEECRKAMTVKREVQEIVDQQLVAGKNNYKETYDCFWEIVKVVQANY